MTAALTVELSALFDGAALAIEAGGAVWGHIAVASALLRGVPV